MDNLINDWDTPICVYDNVEFASCSTMPDLSVHLFVWTQFMDPDSECYFEFVWRKWVAYRNSIELFLPFDYGRPNPTAARKARWTVVVEPSTWLAEVSQSPLVPKNLKHYRVGTITNIFEIIATAPPEIH